MLKGDCNKCIHKDLSVYSNTCMRCGLSRKNYSPITNQDAMARLSPEEFYQRMYWLLFSYGCQFNNTELAVIEWLKQEAEDG